MSLVKKAVPASKKPAGSAKEPSAAVKAMQAARAAKAAAKAGGKSVPAKKPGVKKPGPILFKTPVDFKPSFFEVEFETLRDGLIRGGSVVVNRVRGKWDNPEAKRFDLSTYDIATLVGIATRLGGAAMAPNVLKRLPPKTKFGLILRVAKRAATESLAVSIKGIKRLGVTTSGKPKWVWMNPQSEGTDLINYRKLRRMVRTLAGAFVEVQLPPSTRRGKKSEESDED